MVDIVMFIYREAEYSKDETDKTAEIIIAKSRATEKGTAHMYWNGRLNLFHEREQ